MSVALTVLTDGNISFYYKVSSEPNWDLLKFWIDGTKMGQWSGTVAWTQTTYPVAAGSHTFMWEYVKDGTQSAGSDKAWVDQIIFPPVQSAVIPLGIVTASVPDGWVGKAYSQQLTANGGTVPYVWTDLNNDLDSSGLTLSTGGLLSGTPVKAKQINFTARVQDQASGTSNKAYTFMVYMNGDADGSGAINISDAVYIIAYIFSGGSTPVPTGRGDVDCSSSINISDAVYLISYVFGGGPAPCVASK